MIKVSVIVPIYNVGNYIKKTVCSLFEQTISDVEYIFVDDCSTDNSPNIVKPYVDNDNRIKYIRAKSNQGVSHARNLALKEAQGQFIAFLDSDDIWNEDKLEKQICFMNEKNLINYEHDFRFCIQ